VLIGKKKKLTLFFTHPRGFPEVSYLKVWVDLIS